jgi:hypothetical protein
MALCGASLPAFVALLSGLAIAGLLSGWIRTLRLPGGLTSLTALLVALTWLSPALLDGAYFAGAKLVPGSGMLATLIVLLLPATVVAIATALSLVCAEQMQSDSEASVVPVDGLFAVFGSLPFLWHAIPQWTPWPLALTSSAVTGAAIATRMMFLMPSGNGVTPDSTRNQNHGESSQHDRSSRNNVIVLAFAAAISGIAAVSLFQRLLQLSVPIVIAASGMTSGCLLLLRLASRRRWIAEQSLWLASAMVLALLPFAIPLLRDSALLLNTSTLPVALRMILSAIPLAGILITALIPVCVRVPTRANSGPQMFVTGSAAGAAAGLVALDAGVTPAWLISCGLLLQAMTLFGPVPSVGNTHRKAIIRITGRALTVAGGLLAVCGAWQSSRLPVISALVSSDRAAAALLRGVEPDMILQSTSQRLVTSRPMEGGEVSIWSRSGSMFEFLANGRSLGRVSVDTQTTPQSPEEVLPAVLGLVWHPQPDRVLLLGDDTGSGLQCCTHFPVRQIIAIRRDPRMTELARRFTWRGQLTPPDNDPRVEIRHEPELLALHREPAASLDVIIAGPHGREAADSPELYSAEFYRAAAGRLTNRGVFCQRIRWVNPDAESLKWSMATLSSEFREAGALQIVPGEFVLLATNSPDGLADPELLNRLQREHVRREIATTGWDWAQVAVLPLVTADGDNGLLQGVQPQTTTIANGRDLLAGSVNASVRGDRSGELREAVKRCEVVVNSLVPAGDVHEELKRRLTSLNQQIEILCGMPDEPWTYRKSLRMEMQQNPRPPEEIVKDGNIVRVGHPLDLYRRDYFASLGAAVRELHQPAFKTDVLHELSRFTETSEPLVSHFAHYELVRLHEQAGHPDPAAEFSHRLHLVYFSEPADASVRPVIGAIRQLVEQPQLVAESAARFDHLNALLQKLIERWEARTAWEPRSALRVQNDVDLSIRMANLALDQMESLGPEADVAPAEFRRRRRYVNAALINPLREYGEQILSHRASAPDPSPAGTEDPDDLPLLIGQDLSVAPDVSTN